MVASSEPPNPQKHGPMAYCGEVLGAKPGASETIRVKGDRGDTGSLRLAYPGLLEEGRSGFAGRERERDTLVNISIVRAMFMPCLRSWSWQIIWR